MRSLLIPLLLTSTAFAGACQRGPALGTPDHAGPAHATGPLSTAELNRQLEELRRFSEPFQEFEQAAAAGYGTRITPCWYHGERGGQGYHYGNPSLIDGSVALLEPELLMYEPGPAGELRLVGIEYIVPIAEWQGGTPPTLLGREFHRNDALGIYALHVWLWRHNEAGMFADWNPQISCRHADASEDRAG